MMERDSSRRAGSNDDTKEDPDDDEDEAGKVKEALPGSLPSSAEEGRTIRPPQRRRTRKKTK